jgi:hypothetical protein
MALSLEYLRSLIFSRYVELALANADGERTIEQLRAQAAKEVVAESREQHRDAILAASPGTPAAASTADDGDAFSRVFNKVWKICENMRISKRLIRAAKKHNRKKQSPPIAPNIMTNNPVMVDDALITTIQGPTAPLIRSSGYSTPTLVSDDEFLRGVHCIPAQNLRASIEENQRIKEHRDAQSAAHRAKSKYVG